MCNKQSLVKEKSKQIEELCVNRMAFFQIVNCQVPNEHNEHRISWHQYERTSLFFLCWSNALFITLDFIWLTFILFIHHFLSDWVSCDRVRLGKFINNCDFWLNYSAGMYNKNPFWNKSFVELAFFPVNNWIDRVWTEVRCVLGSLLNLCTNMMPWYHIKKWNNFLFSIEID